MPVIGVSLWRVQAPDDATTDVHKSAETAGEKGSAHLVQDTPRQPRAQTASI